MTKSKNPKETIQKAVIAQVAKPIPRLLWVLGVLLVGVSLWFWYSVDHAFSLRVTETFRDPATWLFFLLLLFVLGLLMALVAIVGIVVHRRLLRIVFFAVAAFAYVLPFGVSLQSVIAVGVILVGWWWFGRTIQQEYQERLKFAPMKLTRHGYSLAILVVIMGVSLANYQYAVANREATYQEQVQTLVDTSTATMGEIFRSQFDEFDPAMSVDDFLVQFVSFRTDPDADSSQIKLELPFNFDNIPEEELMNIEEQLSGASAELTAEALAQVRMQVSDSLGVALEGDEPVQAVLERIARKQINGVLSNVEQFLPLITAVGLFFLLELLTWLYLAISRMFVSFLFSLLRVTKLAAVEEHDAKRDVLVISE